MIQELRIGNYVCCRIGIENAKKYSPFGVIVSISEAHTCAINYNVPPEISSLFYKGKFEDDFTPITLTEDIILKCGFVDNQIELYEDLFLIVDEDDEYNVLLKTREVPGTSYVLPFIYLGTSIKHLHQLQNLYFALTGEELICNLK